MISVSARVVEGHGVASGKSRDSRFPGGTLQMQFPFFRERGLDLSSCHPGTLNLSLSPHRYEILEPAYTFRNVAWHPTEPAEDFSFFSCEVLKSREATPFPAWIYHPHPETKPEHFQSADVLEIIAAEKITGITYGSNLILRVNGDQIRFV